MFESTVLSYLASVAVRSLFLGAVAFGLLLILRVQTAAARHALWTSVLAAMLLLAVLPLFSPPTPLRVLSAQQIVLPEVGAIAAPIPAGSKIAPMTSAGHGIELPQLSQIGVTVYLLGVVLLLVRLSFGYLFTRRLVKASIRTGLEPDAIYESNWVSVPLTVGWLRPKILLPIAWRGWDREKLAAVLAHERTHVRRRDWAIALAAGVNRCVFWFHPLAWWLERHLATLAEHACDDAALLEMDSREPYAQALLDMAAAVKASHGRLVWDAIAMANASEVRMRIERILDETRQIPRGISRLRWAGLAVCSLPLIYAASAVQLAPAPVQEPLQQQREAALDAAKFTTADVSRMEQQLVSHPDDLPTRSLLVAYYFLNSIREPRLSHILWMIQHHPESELTAMNSTGVSPLSNSLNSASDYERAASLWREQVAIHPKDAKVLANAAQFLAQRGGDWSEAERLLKQSGDTTKLANFYNRVLAVSVDSAGTHFAAQDWNSAFVSTVIAELESSTDPMLLQSVGGLLRTAPAMRDGQFAAQAEKVFQPRIDLGNKLIARAEELGGPKFAVRAPVPPALRPNAGGMPAASSAPTVELSQAPQAINKIAPEYPAMAYVAKIEGEVNLDVTIGTNGRVWDVRTSKAPASLAASAITAVWQWTFAPALQNGKPVVARFPLVVSYRLAGGDVPAPSESALKAVMESPRGAGPEPPPPTPQRIRVGANVEMAMLTNKVEAVYPEQARTAGPNGEPLEGTVRLNVIIGKDGTVQSITPADGHPLLVAAAQAAVQQWTYKPTRLNGNPVEVSTTVDITFSAK